MIYALKKNLFASAVSCHTCCQHQRSNLNESLIFCWHFQLATKPPTVCSKRMSGSAAKPLRVLILQPSVNSRTVKKRQRHQSSTSLSNKVSFNTKHDWPFFPPPNNTENYLLYSIWNKHCSSYLWVQHFCWADTRLICKSPRCWRCSWFCVLLILGVDGGIVADPGTFLV